MENNLAHTSSFTSTMVQNNNKSFGGASNRSPKLLRWDEQCAVPIYVKTTKNKKEMDKNENRIEYV
ncbi:hypothetical protein CIL05_00620 [Virgibacillus profundi]|uniref:Uncharacterized protein n=1 Tax=Virgibacillus profundi TaxID=2024555 RepID=A0A2A2IHU1_9BACI|nr:hypothetical protein CIL05_00620 [Virgibacillus profundi]PXY55379.1 hypothetical protein CIT14_00620 [Virgibacillus profundi]